MPRLLLLTGVILPMVNYAFAQDSPDPTPMQCQLIRSAVAQYGFAAARQNALETYGPEAVKTGDKCFTKQEGRDTSSDAPTETEPPGATASPKAINTPNRFVVTDSAPPVSISRMRREGSRPTWRSCRSWCVRYDRFFRSLTAQLFISPISGGAPYL